MKNNITQASNKSVSPEEVFFNWDEGYCLYRETGKNTIGGCGLSYSKIHKIITSPIYLSFKKKNKSARNRFANSVNKNNRQLAEDMVTCLRHQKYILGREDCDIMSKQDKKNSPFLKWAGGKKKLIDTIRELMPVTIDGNYYEPFAGAGSVALNIDAKSVSINDINTDLISLWKAVQSNIEELLEEGRELFSGRYSDEKSYYELRAEFNSIKINTIRKSALFVYLNRHCFNGLCRYNAKGGFNVPIGRYSTIGFPEKELREASVIIKNWDITNVGFLDVIDNAGDGDVVYCDPPYSPLNSISFSDYTKEGFNEKNHVELADAAQRASQRGAIVLISNHDTPFTRKIYEEGGAVIHSLNVSRMIASKSKNRKAASEVIAVFKKR